MKELFKEISFRSESKKMIDFCNRVIDEYLAQGLRLTLRQLYYQLVTKNIIKNEERSYKNLSSLVSDGRLAGQIDWDAIEDRVRVPVIPSEWRDLTSLVDSALYSYRLPRWKNQIYYVELWVEKDALAGVLRPLAHQYHIPLMVNRGYSSQSAMYEASNRFIDQPDDKSTRTILYLGDFDPSGEDMVRDINDRMIIFGCGAEFEIKKIALTLDQVKKYNPPPNPTKHKDPRSAGFIAKYGASSWEVDAINPTELQKIVRREIVSCMDADEMNKVIDKEEIDKKLLRAATEKIMGKGSK
jgi:hypothetical protein